MQLILFHPLKSKMIQVPFFDCVNKMREKNLNLMTKSGLLFSCSKLQGICLSNQRAQNQGLNVAVLPGTAEGPT